MGVLKALTFSASYHLFYGLPLLLTHILCILGICICLEDKSAAEDLFSAGSVLFSFLFSLLLYFSWKKGNSRNGLLILAVLGSLEPQFLCLYPHRGTVFCLCYPGIGECLKRESDREFSTQFNKCLFFP